MAYTSGETIIFDRYWCLLKVQAINSRRPLTDRFRNPQFKWIYWLVACCLLLCQALGQQHRIEHLESSFKLSASTHLSQENPQPNLIKEHQCTLLDALTLSTCLGSSVYKLALLEYSFIASEALDTGEGARSPEEFFQSRAPPAKKSA